MKFTARQVQAQGVLIGNATHILLYGGSRSGKTFLIIRAMCMRAIKAARSRQAIFRFRFNHLKSSIIADTFPKVMETCFPQVKAPIDKTDWFAQFPNGSQIWMGGLDDKERTEKVLGQEHAGLFLNEISQIPYEGRNIAITRLAQAVTQQFDSRVRPLRPRVYYDCNPPSKGHWGYQLFIKKEDPITGNALLRPADYDSLQMNPVDNVENLAPGYLDSLRELPERMRKRFLAGEFAEANPNALWDEDILAKWRVVARSLPDMQRIVIGVDPSGSKDTDNASNDAIGIVIVALGTDGVAYVLEDCTVKAGPARWGSIVLSAFERHAADVVVAEINFGGAMVEHVVQTSRRSNGSRIPFKAVTASRGKVVRAEPIAALCEQGKIRMVGDFPDLEEELLGFSTTGYTGTGSPNRADAMVWACSELFPGLTRREQRAQTQIRYAEM